MLLNYGFFYKVLQTNKKKKKREKMKRFTKQIFKSDFHYNLV